MIKKTAKIQQQKSQIDWAVIQKRMMVMKFLPGYFSGKNWILDNGFWNDLKLWVDDAVWKD